MEWTIAVMLLTTPLPCNSPDEVKKHFPGFDKQSAKSMSIDTMDTPNLRIAIQTLAVQEEWMDKREDRYVLRPDAVGTCFYEEVCLLRVRCEELRHAPKVGESMRFPDRAATNDMLSFNRAYRHNLESQMNMNMDRSADYMSVIRETDGLYSVWDAVRDARCEFYYVTVRRNALKVLRDRVGVEAYYSGDLPPVVPVWRFREIQ